jgi:nickel transport protein
MNSKAIKRPIIRSLLLLSLLLLPATSQAHLLKIFAHQQAMQSTGQIAVNGKIYFSGANPVAGVTLQVLDEDAVLVTSVVSDAQGKFSLVLADRNYQLVANSLDGHVAKWPIGATDSSIKGLKNTQTLTAQQLRSSELNVSLSQLEELMAKQLAQSIQPLNEQIIALQEESRFTDILGALGYIAGLFGVLVLWRGRTTDVKKV